MVERFSGIAFEEDDVPVGKDVILAFQSELPCIPRILHGTGLDQVLVGDDFRLDEGLLEVRMDDTGALGCGHALAEGPCPGFLFACGKETS